MNAGNKSVIDKARDLQYRIEARLKKIKPLTVKEYFSFLTFIFFITGILMFVYAIVLGYNLGEMHLYSDPLFYLILGFGSLVGTIASKHNISEH